MNILFFAIFCVWALFMYYLPHILQIIKLQRWSSGAVSGPPFWEIIYHAKSERILPWLTSLYCRYGTIFRVWVGKDLFMVLSNPDDIRVILNSNTLLHKSKSYDVVEPWLGQGLLIKGGSAWRARRKLLTPAFHFNILSDFKDVIQQNCDILIKKLMVKADGETFDIYPYITLYTLDIICETAMGIKKNAQLDCESLYIKAVQDISRIIYEKMFSAWQIMNPFFIYTKIGRQYQKCLAILHNETTRVIKLRREILENSNKDLKRRKQNDDDDVGQKRRLAFLDMLLISQMDGHPLTDLDIREEVDTFMFEGYDTTSSALSFIIYLLSQHADVQQRAFEEVTVLQNNEQDSWIYLEAIIKESLRLYPAVPLYARKITEDTQLNSLTIPKGCNVVIFAYQVHRDELNFPKPTQFNPERFVNNTSDIHQYSFVPFSAGPRNCIGQKFAYLELKCTLAKLLYNFEFLPAENFKPQLAGEITLKSSNGIQVKLKKRVQ